MKFKLHFVLLALVSICVVFPVLARPTLGIALTNNQAILFWPVNTTGTNAVLESTASLTSPDWLSATDAFPVTYGSHVAVAVTNSPSARIFRLLLVPPAADGMTLVPAGWFKMGDTLDDESDAIPTNVYVSAFYMDTNLVSYAQWQGVYNYATNQGYNFAHAGSGKGTNYPVESVDWYDCVKWCNARSQQAGLTPVYYTDAGLTQLYTNGDDGTTVYANWAAGGYRLPTEAEWEKAARGGLSGKRFPWGDTISESQANYDGNTNLYSYDLGPNGYNAIGMMGGNPYTTPVGTFAPNGYGLYDMAGNVVDLCWDWYAGPPYPAGSPYLGGVDPRGPASGVVRTSRGGDWQGPALLDRCAQRGSGLPYTESGIAGFRCVRAY